MLPTMRARQPELRIPEGDPEWALALRRQVREGGAGAPAETLGPTSILFELRNVCRSMLIGRGGPSDDDRKSLVVDIGKMREGLGPNFVGAANPLLDDFSGQLNQLGRRLKTAHGARVVNLQLDSLLDRLAQPEVGRAAWKDVVAAFQDPDEPAERCELRLLQLRELSELRGHEVLRFGGLATRMDHVLADDPSELARLGDVASTPLDASRRFAGVALDRRVELCGDLVAAAPEVDDTAVWFVLDSAALAGGWLRRGPVQFFSGELFPDHLDADGPLRGYEDYEPPPELRDLDEARRWFDPLPSEHVVLARVWLAGAPVGTARERAREVVEGLIEVVKAESRWVLYEGEVQWRAATGWSGATPTDPAALYEARTAVHPFFEGTGEALEQLQSDFVARLVAQEAAAVEAVEDARWTRTVEREGSATARVALGTRALERTMNIAQVKGEGWYGATARYLLAPWVQLRLRNELLDAGVSATWGLRYRGDETTFRHAEDLVWPSVTPRRSDLNYGGLAQLDSRLPGALPEGSVERRLLRDATERLNSPEAMLTTLGVLRDSFARLLARTRRQRNAVLHGTRPAAGVLASIDDFVIVLGALVAEESMRTAETRREPLVAFEQARARLLEAEARLQAGDDPVWALELDSE